MDERPSRTTIAVGEGVYRLELRMCHCGLCNWRELGRCEEGHEVVHEGGHLLGNRRDIRGTDRVHAIATNPILLSANDTPHPLEPCARQEDSVELADHVEGYQHAFANTQERLRQGMEVPKHLRLSAI